MEARHNQLADKIDTLNLVSIGHRLRSKEGWSLERISKAEREYRRFLLLLALNPGQTFIPWTNDLDVFWHYHILDSRKYDDDCRDVLGRFVHHDPNVTSNAEQYERDRLRTNAAYNNQFSQGGASPSSAIVTNSGYGGDSGGAYWWLAPDHSHDPNALPSWADTGNANARGGDLGHSTDLGNDGGADGGSSDGGGSDGGGSSCGGGGGCGGGGCGGGCGSST